MSKGVFLAEVAANQPICREHWRLVLAVESFPVAAPGQFVQILCRQPSDEGWKGGAFVRRPFSIGGLRRFEGKSQGDGRCEIDILHRAVGPGTRWLAQLHVGDAVSILGPLGTPFEMATQPSIAYLVGGGIGLPPLIWLAEALTRAGQRTVAFCGSRTADLLPLTPEPGIALSSREPTQSYREFAQYGVPCLVATDDGSLGVHGLIPEVFARYLDRHGDQAASAVVYTCGPEAMMRAVARICEERDISCQVCLERMMACGMGTCQSCVVRIHDQTAPDHWRYRQCCTDGPVFDARSILW